MKLIFLGSGDGFSSIPHNFQSNLLIEDPSSPKKHLLIDCGTDIRHSLSAVNFSYKDIDAVYISHFHSDHVGGLEWLAFSTKFQSSGFKLKLFIHPCMVERLWKHVLSGGLQSIQGNSPVKLDDYFELPALREKKYFAWQSVSFELVKTTHVYNGEDLVPSYGLFFTLGETKIFLTTDTRFTPDIFMPYYEAADLIFHDCETTEYESGVHAHFKQLVGLTPNIKAKMWLYHYRDNPAFDAKAHGFLGFVTRGQEFNL